VTLGREKNSRAILSECLGSARQGLLWRLWKIYPLAPCMPSHVNIHVVVITKNSVETCSQGPGIEHDINVFAGWQRVDRDGPIGSPMILSNDRPDDLMKYRFPRLKAILWLSIEHKASSDLSMSLCGVLDSYLIMYIICPILRGHLRSLLS